MIVETLGLRKRELARRIENLPTELKAWRDETETRLDKNAYFSQLRAIEVLMNAFLVEQRTILAALAPNNDANIFNSECLRLVRSLIRAQKAWDFFRDKLELRNSPNHKAPLWTADTIAWDCHRPVLDRAVEFGIVEASKLREPPLVYCTADYSPATWVRGSRPNDGRVYDLGEAVLPIPVIEMPWDHLNSAWEYLSLHHEVGHDIEADLKLRPVLLNSLQQVLGNAHVPIERIRVWLKWVGEIFADLCALQLAGPAFSEALLHLLLLPDNNVKSFDEDDPHPTPYIRILMNSAYIRSLTNTQAINDHAMEIEMRWKTIYGQESGDLTLDALVADFELVFRALMDTVFPALKGHTMRELIPFVEADDVRIRAAEKYFRTGMNRPNSLPLRHTVSAARIAIATEAKAGTLSDEVCSNIHERVVAYVQKEARPGLRGGGANAHEQFIASFATKVFA